MMYRRIYRRQITSVAVEIALPTKKAPLFPLIQFHSNCGWEYQTGRCEDKEKHDEITADIRSVTSQYLLEIKVEGERI